jgi:hypothetical protein
MSTIDFGDELGCCYDLETPQDWMPFQNQDVLVARDEKIS